MLWTFNLVPIKISVPPSEIIVHIPIVRSFKRVESARVWLHSDRTPGYLLLNHPSNSITPSWILVDALARSRNCSNSLISRK